MRLLPLPRPRWWIGWTLRLRLLPGTIWWTLGWLLVGTIRLRLLGNREFLQQLGSQPLEQLLGLHQRLNGRLQGRFQRMLLPPLCRRLAAARLKLAGLLLSRSHWRLSRATVGVTRPRRIPTSLLGLKLRLSAGLPLLWLHLSSLLLSKLMLPLLFAALLHLLESLFNLALTLA
jgi:hypothetical protein